MNRFLQFIKPQLVAPEKTASEVVDYQLTILEPLSPAPALNVPRRKKTPREEARCPGAVALICPESLLVESISEELHVDEHEFLMSEMELFPLGVARIGKFFSQANV